MNLLKLSWKNLINKPLSTLLSIILFALGVGLISLLFLLNTQLEEKFEKNLAGIDLVVGAKGSPLQLILSSMYHIDAPTGNVSIDEVKAFLNPKHPLIKTAVPLSMGDSHAGYRIIGTTHQFLDLYKGEIAEGKRWSNTLEVTIGATVAQEQNLKLGDTFFSSHGFVQDENLVHDDAGAFKVVGILKPSGSVLDQLILTNTQSVWAVHDHDDHDHDEHGDEHEHDDEHDHAAHEHDEHNHDEHDHAAHEHDEHNHDEHDHAAHEHDGHNHDEHDHAAHEHDEHNHDEHDHAAHEHIDQTAEALLAYPDKDITSLLIQFKGRNFQALNMQRSINENTDMQAATPAIEINRLYSLMGVGTDALRWLAFIIVVVSGLSIFISLFNSLKERRYELALMRTMGASPTRLFSMVVLEGLLLAIVGYIFGLLISHLGMDLLAGRLEESYRFSFTGWRFLKEEAFLLGGALFIGFLAAVIPAIQASNTDIHDTLSEK